jgi:hypothetical protein
MGEVHTEGWRISPCPHWRVRGGCVELMGATRRVGVLRGEDGAEEAQRGVTEAAAAHVICYEVPVAYPPQQTAVMLHALGVGAPW